MKIAQKCYCLRNVIMLLFVTSLSKKRAREIGEKSVYVMFALKNYKMVLCNYIKGVSCDKYI